MSTQPSYSADIELQDVTDSRASRTTSTALHSQSYNGTVDRSRSKDSIKSGLIKVMCATAGICTVIAVVALTPAWMMLADDTRREHSTARSDSHITRNGTYSVTAARSHVPTIETRSPTPTFREERDALPTLIVTCVDAKGQEHQICLQPTTITPHEVTSVATLLDNGDIETLLSSASSTSRSFRA